MGNIINADILRQVRGPNVGNTFNTLLSTIERTDQIKQRREESSRDRAEQGLKSIAIFGAQVSPMLEQGDIEGAKATTRRRIAQLVQQGDPTDESRQFLELLDTNPELARTRAGQAAQLGQRLGIFKGQTGQTAGTREFNNLLAVAQDPNSTELEKNSARRKLGDLARKSTSAAERIASDPELSQLIADVEGLKASAKEKAKLGAQLKFKPQITRAVKLAEKEAAARGETLTGLARTEAALPGLRDAVGQLKELALVATSTFGGRLFDAAVRETGFGATKGATARTKFVAIINNQVLPLLKETFGAAFTAQEGETLKATMGDPDTSPEEKLVQLDAFIAQKERDIRSKQLELGQPTQQILQFDAQGNLIQ